MNEGHEEGGPWSKVSWQRQAQGVSSRGHPCSLPGGQKSYQAGSTKVFKARMTMGMASQDSISGRSRLPSLPGEAQPFSGNHLAHQIQSKALLVSAHFIKLDLENMCSIP